MLVSPAYAAHFTDPLYDDNVLDAAPFGDDSGADMLSDVTVLGKVIPADATIASLIPWGGTVEGCFDQAADGDPDGLSMIYAAAFLLLRYLGRISESDYQILRRALEALADWLAASEQRHHAPPEKGSQAIRSIVLPDLDAFVARST